MFATFIASKLAPYVIGFLLIATIIGGAAGTIEYFMIVAKNAKLEVQRTQLDLAEQTNIDQEKAFAVIQAQHILERAILKGEAEASSARATKAEKARTYVRSAPPSACSDAILDPGFADALRGLRKVGSAPASGPTSGAPISP